MNKMIVSLQLSNLVNFIGDNTIGILGPPLEEQIVINIVFSYSSPSLSILYLYPNTHIFVLKSPFWNISLMDVYAGRVNKSHTTQDDKSPYLEGVLLIPSPVFNPKILKKIF